jgi:hypothetical protein
MSLGDSEIPATFSSILGEHERIDGAGAVASDERRTSNIHVNSKHDRTHGITYSSEPWTWLSFDLRSCVSHFWCGVGRNGAHFWRKKKETSWPGDLFHAGWRLALADGLRRREQQHQRYRDSCGRLHR